MKLLKILNEEKLSPIEKRIIGRMLKNELEPENFAYNHNILKNEWLIGDFNLIFKLVHIYQAVYDEISEGDLSILDTKDFSGFNFENIADDYDDEVIALSLFLDISPFDIEKKKYTHYGSMNIYETSEGEYAIGSEEDAESANDQHVENIIEYDLESFMDANSLVDYLIVNEYAIDDLAREMAEERVGDMSDDDIMEEAGYSDEYEEKNDLESDLETLTDEVSDLESDLESTNNEIVDTTNDLQNPENEDDVEYFKNELENYQQQKTNITIAIREKKAQIESINNRLEELGDVSNLIERAKDELIEKFTDDNKSEIEYEGADYFKNNFGYGTKELLNSPFLDLDTDELRRYFGDDRAGNLGHYDGREDDITYKGENYIIYRTN